MDSLHLGQDDKNLTPLPPFRFKKIRLSAPSRLMHSTKWLAKEFPNGTATFFAQTLRLVRHEIWTDKIEFWSNIVQ